MICFDRQLRAVVSLVLLLAAGCRTTLASSPVPQHTAPALSGTCAEQAETELPVIPMRQVQGDSFALALTEVCTKLQSATAAALAGNAVSEDEARALFETTATQAGVTASAGDLKKQASNTAKAFKDVCAALRGDAGIAGLTPAQLQLLWQAHSNPAAFSQFEKSLNAAATSPDNLIVGPLGGALQDLTGAGEALGGLGSTLINGLATFIVDRAKAEAQQYLAQRLRDTLCSAETAPYFRNTCSAFEAIDARMQLAAMGNYLKAASSADLERMPELLAGAAACEAPAAYTEQLTVVRMALAFHREAALREPLDVFSALHEVTLACESHSERSCAESMKVIRTASRLFEAVRKQDGFWTVAKLPRTELKFRAYVLGAVFSFARLASEKVPSVPAERLVAAELLLRGVPQLIARLNELQTNTGGRFGLTDRIAFFNNVFRSGGAAALQLLGKGRDTHPKEWEWFAQTQSLAVVTERLLQLEAARSGAPGAHPAPADVALAIVELNRLLSRWSPTWKDKLPKSVTHALPLLAELARAESSDQVARTLEAASAPVGSYRAKYDGFTVAVNAFLGGAVGTEHISGVNRGFRGTVTSVFAPVGVHAATPLLPSCFKNEVQVGGMLSIIDVGAIASARLDGEVYGRISEEQQVTFRQVFSPGAYVTLGILRSPLTLGFGVSAVPDGRTVQVLQEDGSMSPERRPTVRLMGFLGMDLTLFPF